VTDRLFKSLVEAAKRAVARGNPDEAERAASRLMESYPAEAASHGIALELLLQKGLMDEAGRTADRLVDRFPNSAGILFQAGLAAYKQKKYALAAQRFDESEKLFSSKKTRRMLAKTLINLGRFDDAEGMLINLVEIDPSCRADLAWLFERKGDFGRAAAEAAKRLSEYPDDERARSQKIRLEASALDDAEVIEQVEILEELGERLPNEMVSRYVSALVASGRSDDARRFILTEKSDLDRRAIVDLAWTCHRLQLHDMAFELFILVLEEESRNFKLLNTLDFCAGRAGRAVELAELYETIAVKQKALFGRAKKLRGGEKG
jgi:tetratricopeptide (TPR) repeat protein